MAADWPLEDDACLDSVFSRCAYLPAADLEPLIVSGRLPLCVPGSNGGLFLHIAIDNTDEEVQKLLWKEGEKQAASGRWPCRVSPVDWRAEDLDFKTPLDLAARWGLTRECRFWAARAMAGTVARAVGHALECQWYDCVRALCESAAEANDRWPHRRWWFLLRERGLPPVAGLPEGPFRLIVLFS